MSYADSLRQQARWIKEALDPATPKTQRIDLGDVDTDELEAAADELDRLGAHPAQGKGHSVSDEDESYEIGKRDGYEEAVQELDIFTGGDGEFKGSTLPGGTIDVPTMMARVKARFGDAMGFADLRASGGLFPEAYAAPPALHAALTLADEYEAGLQKMRASGYEEYTKTIPRHELVVKALRHLAGATNGLSSSHSGQRGGDKSRDIETENFHYDAATRTLTSK